MYWEFYTRFEKKSLFEVKIVNDRSIREMRWVRTTFISFVFLLFLSKKIKNKTNSCELGKLCVYSKTLRALTDDLLIFWLSDLVIICHKMSLNLRNGSFYSWEESTWQIQMIQRYIQTERKRAHTHTVCASMPCYMFGFVLFCIFFSNFLSKTTHNVLELFLICGVQWSSTAVHIQYVAFMFTKFLWKKYFGFYSVYYFSGPQVFFRPQVWVTHRHIDLTTFCFCIWKRSIELLLVKAMLLLLLMRCFRYYYCAWERAHARTHAQMVGFIWIQIKW